MKVWCYAHVRNEAALAPWFLRHYSAFCERIIIYDDQSTDGTREIVDAHPKCELRDMPFTGLDENALIDLAHEVIKEATGKADYVMWPDVDEFLYHPQILECLSRFHVSGYSVVRALGFNMMGAPLPADDGVSQLVDLYHTGVRAPVYSKPIIVMPDSGIQWSCGKHSMANEADLRPMPDYRHYEEEYWRVRLLHYRYLTPQYCRERNARQFDRSPVKTTAWSNSPTHTGEHSPQWVEATMRKVHDVVRDGAHWYPPGEMDA